MNIGLPQKIVRANPEPYPATGPAPIEQVPVPVER